MKTIWLWLLATLVTLTFAAAGPVYAQSPDLTVTTIKVTPLRTLEGSFAQGSARVRIRIDVTVKNVGRAAYSNKRDMQGVILTAVIPTTKKTMHIGEMAFPEVRPNEIVVPAGGSFTGLHEMTWSWSASDKTPPGIEATLTFKPRPPQNGKPGNDANLSNNKAVLAGPAIAHVVVGYLKR